MLQFKERLALALGSDKRTKDMIYVGWCYLYGESVPKDIATGLMWYKRAAEAGDVEAQVRLAEIYELGELVNFDCQQAQKWYEQALLAGGFLGDYALGVAYMFGSKCRDLDWRKAYEHFSKAAHAGHLVSKFQVANILKLGHLGLGKRPLGYLIAFVSFCETVWIILMRKQTDRLWDAQRWLSSGPLLSRLRRGTRFE